MTGWPRHLLVLAAVLTTLGVQAADVGMDERALLRIETPPLGLPPVPIPPDNPPTPEKIALGRKLAFDRRLSHNGTMSCAMCHVPEQGFTNNELATPIGVEGRSLRRNAPTLLNAAYQSSMFHDGRDTSLETQVIGPLVARDEMANPSIGYVVARIAALPDYAGRFEEAFGAGPSIGRIGQAIASWERTLLAGDAPFDRWHYGGDEAAVGPEVKRGFTLFTGKAGCAACHLVGERHALFTDQAFHDTGIGARRAARRQRKAGQVRVEIAPGVTTDLGLETVRSVGERPASDLGRYEVTLDPSDIWSFKTPSLRNVALTAPYMHDGSLQSLEQVVRYYDGGGFGHPGLDDRMKPLGLTDAEIAALTAFLESLTSSNVTALIAESRSVPVGN